MQPSTNLTLASLSALMRLGRFALELTGTALSPRYEPGDTLIVETSGTPTDGDGIVVQILTTGELLALLWDAADSSVYNYDKNGEVNQRLAAGTFLIVGSVTDILPSP